MNVMAILCDVDAAGFVLGNLRDGDVQDTILKVGRDSGLVNAGREVEDALEGPNRPL